MYQNWIELYFFYDLQLTIDEFSIFVLYIYGAIKKVPTQVLLVAE